LNRLILHINMLITEKWSYVYYEFLMHHLCFFTSICKNALGIVFLEFVTFLKKNIYLIL